MLETNNEFSRLSLLVLAEKHKGDKSRWAPYIGCLPSSSEVNNTIFWDKEELAFLSCSPVHRETFGRNAMLSSEFDAVQDVVRSHPNVFGHKVMLDDFRLAYATVSSRAWGGGPHSDITMIPFVDFANHNPRIRTIFEHDKHEHSTVVVADRDYSTGDEVCISYGNHSNAILAVDFGFCVPDNPFDEAEIWMEIPCDDPLRDEKLELLSRNNMNTLRNPDGSESGQMPFVIEAINERAEIIPPAARAFARIVCSDSVEDLVSLSQEANALETPLAFSQRRDSTKEAVAMDHLAAVIREHVNDHVRTLEALDLEQGKLRHERLQMVETLLIGELRLLQKAAAAANKTA